MYSLHLNTNLYDYVYLYYAFTCVKMRVLTTFTVVCVVQDVEYHQHQIICAASL